MKRPEYVQTVKFGGYVRIEWDNERQRNRFIHDGYDAVHAIPYDIPVVGYGNNMVNALRIWDAQPVQEFNLASFDKGDYLQAVEQEKPRQKILWRSFIRTIIITAVKNFV